MSSTNIVDFDKFIELNQFKNPWNTMKGLTPVCLC